MKVTVKMFARARDLAGQEQVTVTLPDGATIAALRQQLASEYPQLASLLTRSAFAVNNEFAQETQVIPAEAVVAFLPPVSGG
jgi:molybdopterin converting factor subunit 1